MNSFAYGYKLTAVYIIIVSFVKEEKDDEFFQDYVKRIEEFLQIPLNRFAKKEEHITKFKKQRNPVLTNLELVEAVSLKDLEKAEKILKENPFAVDSLDLR